MDQPILGRGLGSLIPEKNNINSEERSDQQSPNFENNGDDLIIHSEEDSQTNKEPETVSEQNQNDVEDNDVLKTYASRIFNLEIHLIKSNPLQPRKEFSAESLQELAKSIEEFGILEPLIVYKIENEFPEGTKIEYRLLAGERRLRAAQILGLKSVPAIIRPNPAEREKLAIALIENIQRDDLNAVERARAFARMSEEFGMSQREIASQLGKSREYIANSVRLLSLPMEAQKALEENKITEGHAKIILAAASLEQRRVLLAHALNNKPTVRELEFIAKNQFAKLRAPETRAGSFSMLDPALNDMKTRLEEALGAEVKIKQRGKKSELAISFYSSEELEKIISRLLPHSQ